MIYDTRNAFHLQVGVVRGTSGECGDRNFPDIYGRLENYEILNWIYRIAFGQMLRNQRPTTSRPQGSRVQENKPKSPMRNRSKYFEILSEKCTFFKPMLFSEKYYLFL